MNIIDIYIGFITISGFANIFFGILVYSRNKKNIFGLTFLLLTMALALWALSYVIWLAQPVDSYALYWSRILNLGAIIIPIFFLHWTVSFLSINAQEKWTIRIGYIITLFFVSISFSVLFISNVAEVGPFLFWPQAGPFYTLFLSTTFFPFLMYGAYLMVKKYKVMQSSKRIEVHYILMGLIVALIGGGSNFTLMYGHYIFPYLNIIVASQPLIWAYGAIKYNIFRHKATIIEFMIFALWLIILIKFVNTTNEHGNIEGILLLVSFLYGIYIINTFTKEAETRSTVSALVNQLQLANNRLEILDQQKSEFISIASHQLRTPLTAIKGYASMLLEGSFGNIPKKAQMPINAIFAASQRLVKTVENFLALSRLEQSRMQYQFETVDLKELVEKIIKESKPAIEEKELILKYSVDVRKKYKINADYIKIHHAISNLIDNSIQHTKQGLIDISLQYTMSKNIRLTISDTGDGMSGSKLDKIFDKNVDNVKQSSFDLYVAHEIINAHDAAIRVESDGVGHGITFFIEFEPEGTKLYD